MNLRAFAERAELGGGFFKRLNTTARDGDVRTEGDELRGDGPTARCQRDREGDAGPAARNDDVVALEEPC